MTSTLMDQIAAAPDEPAPLDDLLTGAEFEDAPAQRTTEPTPKRRGRPPKPKYDDEGNLIPPTPRQPRASSKLSDDLLETTVSFASDISAVAPTVAGVLIARAEKTVDGLLALSAGHTRTTAVLKRVASASKVTELLSTVLLIAVAAAVDFGRIPAESPLLDRIGYTELTRDEKGKPKKDDQGKFIKDRKTIRDIYNVMHPEEGAPSGPVQYDVPPWQPSRGAPPYMAPMNMSAGIPPWERPEWNQ